MSVSETAEWARLGGVAREQAQTSARDLFAAEPDRLGALSLEAAGLYLDFSKQSVSDEALAGLLALAEARGVTAARDAMFAGEHVNATEDRPALHAALRGAVGPAEARADAERTAARTRAFADAVRAGEELGVTGRRFTHILHLGIGGSGLGPKLVSEALKRHADPDITLRVVSNVDPAELSDALEGFDPEATLVVIVSKSFTTQETRLNAEAARFWLSQTLGDRAGEHLLAVTAKPERARAFGVRDERIFGFRDWVGGRFSVWSAVGVTLEIALGPEAFARFRGGAAAMDAHFRDAPLSRNAPVLMALIEVWNRNFLNKPARVVAPYSSRLVSLPGYLQQLEMESNGKGVTMDGLPVPCATAPVVFGAPGADAQHAFFQQLHQGPEALPVDFIGVLQDDEARPEMHRALLANLFAQPEALMLGQTEASVRATLEAETGDPAAAAQAAPHRTFPGGRPSTLILAPRLDPESLGALLALHEHKVFVESVIWGINAFDQWGVELGKTLAKSVLAELEGGPDAKRDPSTAAAIARARAVSTEPAG